MHETVVPILTEIDRYGQRNRHWGRLKRAWLDAPPNQALPWLLDAYGLDIKLTQDGMLTAEYTIADPAKYTIFLLKYGK